MTGPYNFTESQINSSVLKQPGTYVLANADNNAIYVGRSDSDLQSRLKNHLPGNEVNPCINRSGVVFFYFDNTQHELNAYDLECRWYHKFKPTCNIAHPDKNVSNWYCPVCKL